MRPIFISGTGTGIGKTVVSALLAEALGADYWKPVQAGREPETDSQRVGSLISKSGIRIHPETYILELAASPHIAAREENRRIELSRILDDFRKFDPERQLIIEGAGGLLVPLNEAEFVLDLVNELDAQVILVSRNYLGSINHSLMTAGLCKQYDIDVAGWIFNDRYLDYEKEIADWSGYPCLLSMPKLDPVNRVNIQSAARVAATQLRQVMPGLSGHQAE